MQSSQKRLFQETLAKQHREMETTMHNDSKHTTPLKGAGKAWQVHPFPRQCLHAIGCTIKYKCMPSFRKPGKLRGAAEG